MYFRFILFFLLFILQSDIFSQEKIIKLEGTYNGKNLFVQNPFSSGAGYCTSKILINGKNFNFSLNSSAFEINFAEFNINSGDKIKIEIFHQNSCVPKVLNPEVLKIEVEKENETTIEKKWGEGKLIEKGFFKNNKLWEGSKTYYDSKGINQKQEVIEEGKVIFTVDSKKERKLNPDKYLSEKNFYEFISFENRNHSMLLNFEQLKNKYLNGEVNKLDSNGNLSGLWIITDKNEDFVKNKIEQSQKWLDSVLHEFALENNFEIIDNTKKTLFLSNQSLQKVSKVNLLKNQILIDYQFKSTLPKVKKISNSSKVSKTDTIFNVGYFWHSLKTGIWFNYDIAGDISAKIEFRLGAADGMAITYYPNGEIKEMGQWQVNRWVGTYQNFSENGRLKQQYHFNQDGKREGIMRNYHFNGTISEIGTMLDGKESGYFLAFDTLGQLTGVSYCRFGKCNDTLLVDTSEIEILRSFVRNENQIIFRAKKLSETQKDLELQKSNLEKEKSQRLLLYIGLVGAVIITLLLSFFVIRIRKSRKIIQHQKRETELQKEIIEEKQKEIIDSINYAQRIQQTLLAHDHVLKNNLSEYFILFMPKDIVSGDFYWASEQISEKNQKQFYLAICDSTGHGIPGAFMSLLNISFLNEAINEMKMQNPGEILNHIRNRLIKNISQDGAKDGMDGILVKFENQKIYYSAANNVPIVVSKGVANTELPFDKMPVGMGNKEDSFLTHELKTKTGDMVYFYTDGYADQFGGAKGKKYKYKRLNELLVSISNKDLSEQRTLLQNEILNWKGDLEQVDDVCIIGIRV